MYHQSKICTNSVRRQNIKQRTGNEWTLSPGIFTIQLHHIFLLFMYLFVPQTKKSYYFCLPGKQKTKGGEQVGTCTRHRYLKNRIKSYFCTIFVPQTKQFFYHLGFLSNRNERVLGNKATGLSQLYKSS